MIEKLKRLWWWLEISTDKPTLAEQRLEATLIWGGLLCMTLYLVLLAIAGAPWLPT